MRRREKYFITGAAGFVGSCLARYLVERGEEVSILIKPDTNPWRLKDIRRRLSVFEGNLTDLKRVLNR